MLSKTIVLFLLLQTSPMALAQVAEGPQRKDHAAGTAHPDLTPEEALMVYDLALEGPNTIEFELVNRSNRPITAWAVDISAQADSGIASMTMTQDYAVSSYSADEADPGTRHSQGPLVPGQSHHYSFPLNAGAGPIADPVVTVRTVVFFDRSSIGDEWFSDNFFHNREAKQRELGRLLVNLRQTQERGSTAQALEELKEQIKSGERQDSLGFAQLYGSFEAAKLDSDQLLANLVDEFERQYEAMAYHSKAAGDSQNK